MKNLHHGSLRMLRDTVKQECRMEEPALKRRREFEITARAENQFPRKFRNAT